MTNNKLLLKLLLIMFVLIAGLRLYSADVYAAIYFPSTSADERNAFKLLYDTYWQNPLIDYSKLDAIIEVINNGTTSIGVDKNPKGVYGLTMDNYWLLWKYLTFTRADIIGWTYLNCSYILNNNTTTLKSYYLYYTPTYKSDRIVFQQKLSEYYEQIDSIIPEGASDFEKVHIVHDYIVANTAYDKCSLDLGYEPIHSTNYFDIYYPYDASGVIVKHYSVCQGTSLAFKLVMDHLGIRCGIAESPECNHAWNVVKLGNIWYHVDLTADDPTYDILGRVSHKYLCISTDTLIGYQSARADYRVYLDLLTGDYGQYQESFKDVDANDKSYETGQHWNGCNSACYYYDGHIYTVNEYNCVEKDGELYYTPECSNLVWRPNKIEGATYNSDTGTDGKLVGVGNCIYTISPENIFKVNLDTGKSETVYTYQPGEGWDPNQIFGLACIDGQLYYTLEPARPINYNEVWIPLTDDPVISSGRIEKNKGDSDYGIIGYVFKGNSLYINGTVPPKNKLYIAQYSSDGQMLSLQLLSNADTRLYAMSENTSKVKLLLADSSLIPFGNSGTAEY